MFQDLSEANFISIDLETYDPTLKEFGNGAYRDGYILGIALGTDTGIREYYPLRHINSQNLDEQKVFAYLREQLGHENQAKIGANLLYDLEYLYKNNVHVKGKLIDVLIAEPLIDENQSKYSLDMLAQKYLGETKKKDWLEQRCIELKLKGDARQYIYKFTADEIRDYALGDVDIPLRVFKEQYKILEQEELLEVFSVESRLIPLLLQMKITGCRIDVAKTMQLRDELIHKKNELKAQIEEWGLDASTSDAGRHRMAAFFIENGLEVPKTPKSNKPSFTKETLKSVDNPRIKALLEYKALTKFIKDTLEESLLASLRKNRIHAQFNQLRDSTNGTVTGRFSSSRPNLQNIPARSDLGLACRDLFIPEEGELFGSIDYSQIELRLLAHFAMGEGAEEIQKAFQENPMLDIHKWSAEIAGLIRPEYTPQQNKKGRDTAKTINFGIVYGQGVALTAKNLNITIPEAKSFLQIFHEKLPFAKFTAEKAMSLAEKRGWVRTILGRRRRFNKWEPAAYGPKVDPLPYKEAKQKWGTAIKRANTYKALNAVIQGSSADLIKLAMVLAYEAGLFKILTPLTTVHDELNVSVPQTNEGLQAFAELVKIMQNCYSFDVPIIAESGLGPTWKTAKK